MLWHVDIKSGCPWKVGSVNLEASSVMWIWVGSVRECCRAFIELKCWFLGQLAIEVVVVHADISSCVGYHARVCRVCRAITGATATMLLQWP